MGGFEIDGNMDAKTCGGTDWSSVSPASTSLGGTYKTSNNDGSDPSQWTSSGNSPQKDIFSTVYSYAQVVNGQYFAYVAWERASNTGTGAFAIEIDNAGTRVARRHAPARPVPGWLRLLHHDSG